MAVYKEQNKNAYLKYFRATMPKYKKTGKAADKPLTFGRWRDGGPKDTSKKAVVTKAKKKPTTARTKAVSTKLKRSGLTAAELKRLRD